MTRRLISSERDLAIAIKIFKHITHIDQSERKYVAIIPKQILRQRIVLQKALILKAYGRLKESATLLTNLLKMSGIFDPEVRKEALKTLYSIFKSHPSGNLIEKYPESKNIELMLQLYQGNKNKNMVICVDTLNDQHFQTKKRL